MLLSYLIFSISSTDFSDIFSAHFQPLENVLGLVQNLNQNLVTELAPLGLGDLSGLELAEVDVVLVFHAQRLDDFSDIVNGFRVFFQIFFLRLRLTTGLESRKKAYKKEKFFYKKSLTWRAKHGRLTMWGDPPFPPTCNSIGCTSTTEALY